MLSHTTLIRILYCTALALLLAAAFGLYILLQSKEVVYETVYVEARVEPFPVGVDPLARTIVETDLQNDLADENLASEPDTLLETILALFSDRDWYQNLASPVSRIVVVWPGQRKEEVTEHIGDILRWNTEERARFIEIITTSEPIMTDGTFYPGKYVTHRGATPEEVAQLLQDAFIENILDRYQSKVEEVVPLAEALIIASLLEREASDFENMREISGVIWNRLFIDMPLQLDATLQYVRANNGGTNWWPAARPADKFTPSPYNTYIHAGLPPAPIGNPSATAVLAALNPRSTTCVYYFHDTSKNYYCSETYEEHVDKLKATYGRGR